MSLELLISTMHKSTDEVLRMLRQSNVKCDVLVVVQCDTENYVELDNGGQSIRVIFTKERGLSKSRNLCLKYCSSKYAYIMDDDVLLDINAIEELVKKMEVDDVDLATCKYIRENGKYPKRYLEAEFSHTLLSAAQVSSIEICFKVDVIRNLGIKFDERFGLGTNLPSGEEYIFLTDCIKKGLNVRYYPILIGVHPEFTSGLDFYTKTNKIIAKREMFKRIFGKNYIFFIIAFWLKKFHIAFKAGYGLRFTQAILFGK